MPAVLIMSIFSFLMALMGGLILNMSQSRQELTQNLIDETQKYFSTINSYVLKDVTPNHFEVWPRPLTGMTPQAQGEAFLNRLEIRRLGVPSMDGDPLKDAWGNPLVVHLVQQLVAFDVHTRAPVTGVLLLSGGPDRIIQTALPGRPTLLAYGGVIPQADDILMYFTDDEAQKNNYLNLQNLLEKLRAPLEQEFAARLSVYRQTVATKYQSDVLVNPSLPPPNLTFLASTDPAFPAFPNPSYANVRKKLGLEGIFNQIERVLPQGGRLRVVRLPRDPTKPLEMTYGVRNDSVNPTAWRFPKGGQPGIRITIDANLP